MVDMLPVLISCGPDIKNDEDSTWRTAKKVIHFVGGSLRVLGF